MLLVAVTSKGAKVHAVDAFSGVITDSFLWCHIKASYALTGDVLNVTADSHEDVIEKKITEALTAMRAAPRTP